MPVVGHTAPDFALQSDVNGMVSLSRYRGKNVVLYFYPKDDTPGCTREACSFQEHKPKLIGENAVVIGVSPDGPESHKKFRAKYGLDFVLVSDEERELCKAYGVWVEKNNYGKKYMGVQRATFLIDGQGRVAYVWPKVSVDGHTEAVLAELARLN
jgi:peroxiredoxin Q/BCP